MKVLVSTSAADSPSVTDILSCGTFALETLGGTGGDVTEGAVAEMPDAAIAAYVKKLALSGEAGAYFDPKEARRDLKATARIIAPVEVGGVVKVKAVKRGVQFILPKREAAELEVGDAVAFNAYCSPKYLLNARGKVIEVLGADKVRIAVDQSDLKRLQQAGRDRFKEQVRCPIGILDKVEA